MDIFTLISLIGGLALFLYGMEEMGNGLTNLSGGRMEALLAKLTSNRFKAVLLGLAVTAVIQSSSATTVMVVGFVNSGIMQLTQAAGVIMGANIGTTVTAWLISLTGIESDNAILRLFKPTTFSPILAAVGIIFIMFSKEKKKKDIGTIMVGFAVLMYGMETMSSAVEPLADVPEFTNLMTAFTNPVLGIAVGAIITGIIQSSSASVGILQALCMTGTVPYAVAIPVIMGQNIGTCVTALISSIGASRNARRAAMIHLYFNMIGTIIFTTAFYALNAVVGFEFINRMATPAGIAVIHSLFNISVTILLFPFLNQLVRLANFTVKDKASDTESGLPEELARLDERFLNQPAVAVQQSREVLISMAEKSVEAMKLAMSLMDRFDPATVQRVRKLENETDQYEDVLGTYLVQAAERENSPEDSERISVYLQNIGDLERVADHSVNLAEAFEEMQNKGIEFSAAAVSDLHVLTDAVTEVMDLTLKAITDGSREEAMRIEPLEEVVDDLKIEVRERHVARLREGLCTLELGYVLADVSTDLERVSDHCSNLASSLILADKGGYDEHEYRRDYMAKDSDEFGREYREMSRKYSLA